MRKALLNLFLFCLIFSAKAQHKLPSLDYQPQSPTTAAFTRYGDIPVDLSTGVPSISIPIYTLSSHGINLPISISYHASGIKVQDVASAVGLGWTLNAGGIITRSVFGQPDEQLDIITSGQPVTHRPPFSTTEEFRQFSYRYGNPEDFASDLHHFYLNKVTYDYYSDRYYYNLGNGESGIFRRDFQNDTIRLIPYKPTKVKFYWKNGVVSHENLMISMTAVDGNIYHFKRNRFDLWHLDRIVNSSYTDSVQFYTHYEEAQAWSYNDGSKFGVYRNSVYERTEPYVRDASPGNPCWQTLEIGGVNRSDRVADYNNVIDEILVIDSIVASNGVIRFSYVQDRSDGPPSLGLKSRLTNVQVYSKPEGILIKNVNFFNSIRSDGDILSKRLFLDSVQIGASREEKYAFKYNPMPLPLYPVLADFNGNPAETIFNEDFWGYYNGHWSNSLLSTQFTNAAGAGNRFPDENYAKAGILEEINYPTGGKTVFEFESNRVSTDFYGYGFDQSEIPADGKIGGLRVKKIATYPYGGATPQVKQYEYTCNLPAVYGYMWYDMFVYYQQVFHTFTPKDFNGNWCQFYYHNYSQHNVAVAKPFGRVIGTSRAPLVYDEVTEYVGNGNSNIGKTIYYYYLPDQGEDYNSDPRFQGPYPYDRGNYAPTLLKKEEYKNENGQYKIVRKTETLTNVVKQKTFITGFNLESDLIFNSLNGNDPFDYYNMGLHYDFIGTLYYKENKGYTDLIVPYETSVCEYVDGNQYLKTTTKYEYNDYCQQISAITTTSKGDVLTTKYKYPVDYSSQAPYNTMVERNNISPVIEQSSYKNNTNFLQSTKTNYDYWDRASANWGYNGDNFLIVPKTVETRKGGNAAETRLQYYLYDENGNPRYVAKENDVRQLYIWAYNKTYPIAQVLNVPEVQRSTVSYTSFEDNNSGGWALFGSVQYVDDNSVPTGKRCLALNPVGLSKGISNSTAYILSYWYKAGSTVNVSGNSTILTSSVPKNGWIYVKRKITGTSDLYISGSGYIDEVRLYPESAQMTTYAYEPLIGVTAQCDVNDRITYYSYDASGRLTLIKDDDGNILKKICYNYQGQVENCGVNVTPQWITTGATRCKPCPVNSNYITNILQQEERDNNSNSDSYGITRWVDTDIPGNCFSPPDWRNTANTRCVIVGGQITGEQEQEKLDVNPCSNYFGELRWVSVGMNTAACVPPAVFNSLDVSGNYYSQNCSSTQLGLPYYVSMPDGSFTSTSSIPDATNLARQEAQRRANVSGGCTTIYVRLVKENEIFTDVGAAADFYFRFYSDAAGTVRTTLPADVVINWRMHFYWTYNGGPPTGEDYNIIEIIRADAGMDEVSLKDVETLNCRYGGDCVHFEPTLSGGRYVMIP